MPDEIQPLSPAPIVPVAPVAPAPPLPENANTASQKITTIQENVQTAEGHKLSLSQESASATSKRQSNLVQEIIQGAIALLLTVGVVWTTLEKIPNQELTIPLAAILGFYFGRGQIIAKPTTNG